jgi:hypothetical protein
MAIHLNNIRIALCSYKIARAVHKNGFGTLHATSRRLELALPKRSEFVLPKKSGFVPSIGEIIHIGYKKVSLELMPSLRVPGEINNVFAYEGLILSINPLIKGGQIYHCLRSLIEHGLEPSRGILEKSGIRVLENLKAAEKSAE